MTIQQKVYITLLKRPIGFLGALMALIVTSPIILGTVIVLFFANKNGFKGIFFTQDRPGKGEKIFKIIKFKTMTDERDGEGELLPDAMRLTKVGKFIRSTSIDELPQFVNMLKGDMALIGPRPLLVKYLPYYTKEESHRHDVRPGITGWAQIHGRNSISSWEQRFTYDIEYVNKISLCLDIKIFFMTIKNVIKSEGVVVPGFQDDFDVYRMKQRGEYKMNKTDILQELNWILTYKTPIVPLIDDDNNLFVMKEDCIPFSFGGNKCRIAASYFKDLIRKGCDVVITYGASSSNLCRVIANMSYRYGVKCIIVTPDELSEATCNSEMVEFLGAERVKCPLDNVSKTIEAVIEKFKKTNNPYFIYGGGHGVLGTESYRDVIRQIADYEKNTGVTFDYIFITLATGTSMSGIVVENELGGYGKKVYGVSIAREYEKVCQIMKDVIKEYNEKLDGVFDNGNYKILGEYRCGGYGKYDENILNIIRQEFLTNGLNLDSTYTGKAFYGMKDFLSKNGIKGNNVLFIHTGGTPLFFKDTCKYLSNKR